MLRHREKVLAHAEQQLRSQGALNPAELLSLYKKFLKIENHRIRLKHYSGGGGREICAQRASLVDIVLRHLLDAAIETAGDHGKLPKLALVAIGGYGRGELNPFSDVDIMFLHADSMKQLDPRLNDIVQKILYMLWDMGFKVGHSTRSISGAVKQANADMLSKTALLESRLIAGDSQLFGQFRTAFVKGCVDGHEEQYITDRVKNQEERHAKFGHTVYMQEPNIKNGCGGLRDYQNLLWISFFKERVQSTAGLVEKKLINEAERRQLDRAYDFLLRIRTELHYANKRSTDVILMSQQLQLANKLSYPQKNILRRSEAFMRDYYLHARNIYAITALLSERMSVAPAAAPKRRGLLRFLPGARAPKTESFDGFYSLGGQLYAESSGIFAQEPARMMRLFQHLQQRGLRMSPELATLVRRRLHLVDRTFQYARKTRETFLAICSRKGEVGAILRAMHDVDFLGRYIPEFGQLTCLVQHEFFHRYTADEHTLVCIEKLDALMDEANPRLQDYEYKKLFVKLEDPCVLYLALLLHDTGKAANAKVHAEASALFAQKVARRLQLTPEQRKSLVLLVDNHIALSMTAQRRNIEDPATIAEFASIVKNQANLDALMLLTLVDGRGTGDENWSDWKEGLVWHLYRSTSLYLADGEAFYRQRAIEREALRAAVGKKFAGEFREEVDAHFEYMPERYFQTYGPSEIVEHIRLFRRFLEARFRDESLRLAPAMKWVPHPDRGHSEFWFCGWDRTGLLARIAGSLSVSQLNILSADVFTRSDSLVLDIFRVCNWKFEAVTDEKDMALVEKRLRQSIEEEHYDFAPTLAKAMKKSGFHLSQELDFPTRIIIDNDAHPVYTLVDIQSPDRLGLLYSLLRAFADTGVQIALSRISTENGAAIDGFYITDSEGKKLRNAETVARLQKALQIASQGIQPAG
jgi:[protein-PII] uridylyltransferase